MHLFYLENLLPLGSTTFMRTAEWACLRFNFNIFLIRQLILREYVCPPCRLWGWSVLRIFSRLVLEDFPASSSWNIFRIEFSMVGKHPRLFGTDVGDLRRQQTCPKPQCHSFFLYSNPFSCIRTPLLWILFLYSNSFSCIWTHFLYLNLSIHC